MLGPGTNSIFAVKQDEPQTADSKLRSINCPFAGSFTVVAMAVGHQQLRILWH